MGGAQGVVNCVGSGLCFSPYLHCDLANYLTSLSFLFHSSKTEILSPWPSRVALVVKKLPANAGESRNVGLISLDPEDPLEEETGTHSSILALRIPWTQEPGGLQSMGSHRSQMQLKQLSTHTSTYLFHRADVRNRKDNAFRSIAMQWSVRCPITELASSGESLESPGASMLRVFVVLSSSEAWEPQSDSGE